MTENKQKAKIVTVWHKNAHTLLYAEVAAQFNLSEGSRIGSERELMMALMANVIYGINLVKAEQGSRL